MVPVLLSAGTYTTYKSAWAFFVAYPWVRAMRRPEGRDKLKVETPMPFLFPLTNLMLTAEFGSQEATKFGENHEKNYPKHRSLLIGRLTDFLCTDFKGTDERT